MDPENKTLQFFDILVEKCWITKVIKYKWIKLYFSWGKLLYKAGRIQHVELKIRQRSPDITSCPVSGPPASVSQQLIQHLFPSLLLNLKLNWNWNHCDYDKTRVRGFDLQDSPSLLKTVAVRETWRTEHLLPVPWCTRNKKRRAVETLFLFCRSFSLLVSVLGRWGELKNFLWTTGNTRKWREEKGEEEEEGWKHASTDATSCKARDPPPLTAASWEMSCRWRSSQVRQFDVQRLRWHVR